MGFMKKLSDLNKKLDQNLTNRAKIVKENQERTAYAQQYEHVAPNRMEFMDRLEVWEMYKEKREAEGWWLSKTTGRTSCEWEVDGVTIKAEQDDWDGSIKEKKKAVRKPK